MIHSLFIINEAGDIFCEKHWKTVISTSICDYFFEALKKSKASGIGSLPNYAPTKVGSEQTTATLKTDNVTKLSISECGIVPVIQTPQHVLVTLYREQIYYVSVISKEVPPLFVLEFLHRCVDTFKDYFSEANEHTLKDNLVVVYEILDEMLDNGFPLATEPNILQELIKPPSFWASVQQVMSGSGNVADHLPQGQLSNVPWRRAGVNHNNDEAFFDVIEELNAVVNGRTGQIMHLEINGSIEANIKLSGMPDLLLSFVNPRILDDGVTFHPCVRYRRWSSDRVLSFIPPDGRFRLMSYHVATESVTPAIELPLLVRPVINWQPPSSQRREQTNGNFMPKIEIYMQVKQQTFAYDAPQYFKLDDVAVEILMPQQVASCSALSTSTGRASFNATTKVLQWTIDMLGGPMSAQLQSPPVLRGTVVIAAGCSVPISCRPEAIVRFKLDHVALSGLRVNRLDIHGDKPFKAFRGVKYQTRAGSYTVRTV